MIDIKLLVVQADDGLICFFDMRICLIVIYVVAIYCSFKLLGINLNLYCFVGYYDVGNCDFFSFYVEIIILFIIHIILVKKSFFDQQNP